MTYGALYGIDVARAEKIAAGFGAGIGGMRGTCGAFSSIVMIAGLARGYDVKDIKDKAVFYKQVRDLHDAFVSANGAGDCKALLCSLVPDLKQEPSERTPAYYKGRPCGAFIRAAAQILEEKVIGSENA